MEAIQLDTHIVAWLWQGQAAKVKKIARCVKGREVRVSPAVVLELQLLHEIGRLKHDADEIMEGLARTTGLMQSGTPFARVVAQSVRLSWCRDPFDRLIVAQAIADKSRLLTCDDTILKHYRKAVEL
jgi:PIN domain nuclease of toxin-antitoxin system